jgi:hypothetical protein
MPATIERGRWYPSPAPGLDGESDDAYTDRLAGANGTDRRPYDHPRSRECSIGWHSECSDPSGAVCKCPHHADAAAGADHLPLPLKAGAVKLASLYDLPAVTSLKVMIIASRAAQGGVSVPRDALAAGLEAAYECPQSGDFVTDVVNVYHAAATGTLQ